MILEQIAQDRITKSSIEDRASSFIQTFFSYYTLLLFLAKEHHEVLSKIKWTEKDIQDLKTKNFPAQAAESFTNTLANIENKIRAYDNKVYRMARQERRVARKAA